MSGTFACPVCGRDTPHQHTDDEIQAARLMAMPEAEVDAELRRLGIDPDEAARQGKAAVEGALEAIRARNAGVRAWLPKQDSEALAQAVAAHIDGWRSATFGWQGDADPIKDADNRQRAIQAHAAECLRRIRATLGVPGTPGGQQP